MADIYFEWFKEFQNCDLLFFDFDQDQSVICDPIYLEWFKEFDNCDNLFYFDFDQDQSVFCDEDCWAPNWFDAHHYYCDYIAGDTDDIEDWSS